MIIKNWYGACLYIIFLLIASTVSTSYVHHTCLNNIFQRQIYLKLFQAEQDDIMISVSMMIQKMLILLHLNMLKVMLFQMPTMNNSPFFHFLTQIWSDLFIPAVDSSGSPAV